VIQFVDAMFVSYAKRLEVGKSIFKGLRKIVRSDCLLLFPPWSIPKGIQGGAMDLRKKVRLLVVESELDYQRKLRDVIDLCSHQYEIVCEFAASGKDAKELLARFEPSVVLMDVESSGTENFDLMRGCSEMEVPVIASAELMTRDVEERAIRNGAVALITRTEDPEELESLLHTAATISTDAHIRH
jgi:CheY-like chemotaxis protein